MSSIVNRFADPPFLITVIAMIVGTIVLGASIDSYFVGGIVSILAIGAIYVFYQDYIEKQKTDLAEDAKEDDLKRRIQFQAKAEAEKGKCISCLTELPKDAEKCPNCGFAVKHYSVEA